MDDPALVRVFRALGHENRLRLFMDIWRAGSGSYAEGHACFLRDLIERLNVGAPTVSAGNDIRSGEAVPRVEARPMRGGARRAGS